MATAAETTAIIQLVVGMVDAAPGRDILTELEDIIDSGLTMEELAIAIQENPAFSGDTGLFPNFLPNAIFAAQFMEALLGDEVAADDLAAATDELTASLNAGDSRGAAMYASIVSLAASTDPLFADAAAALANKVEVAEYYSVEAEQSSDDLDDLIAVVSSVTSDADAVEDGIDAVDDVIAGAQPLETLINNLDAANDAVTAYLVTADGDGLATTTATQADVLTTDIGTALAAVEAASGVVGYAALAAAPATVNEAAGLLADAQVAQGLAVTTPVTGTAALLAAASAAVGGTASITGLDSAIAVHAAAVVAEDATNDAEIIAEADFVAAIAAYDVGSANAVVTAVVPDTVLAGVSDAGGAIIDATTGGTLKLVTGVTEVTNPGVTALLAALNTRNAAVTADTNAETAVQTALDLINNLDPGAPHGALSDTVEALFSVTTASAAPTITEFEIESIALNGLADPAAIALLSAALAATINVGETIALTAPAVAAGTISAADAALIDVTFGGATTAVLAANNPDARATAFDAAYGLYLADDTLGAITTTYNGAVVANGLALAAIAGTDAAVAALGAANTAAAELTALNLAAAGATSAFGDAGFGVPVTLSAAIVVATAADDVYLTDDSDSQIINFGVDTTADGEDQLFVGTDLTLNTDSVGGANGDDAVLEVWITGTTNTTITIETSVFGSSAAVEETFTIELSGVNSADVSLDGGIITIA